jgi:hypothetical protein
MSIKEKRDPLMGLTVESLKSPMVVAGGRSTNYVSNVEKNLK